jgi:hypothetical protein
MQGSLTGGDNLKHSIASAAESSLQLLKSYAVFYSPANYEVNKAEALLLSNQRLRGNTHWHNGIRYIRVQDIKSTGCPLMDE